MGDELWAIAANSAVETLNEGAGSEVRVQPATKKADNVSESRSHALASYVNRRDELVQIASIGSTIQLNARLMIVINNEAVLGAEDSKLL